MEIQDFNGNDYIIGGAIALFGIAFLLFCLYCKIEYYFHNRKNNIKWKR